MFNRKKDAKELEVTFDNREITINKYPSPDGNLVFTFVWWCRGHRMEYVAAASDKELAVNEFTAIYPKAKGCEVSEILRYRS